MWILGVQIVFQTTKLDEVTQVPSRDREVKNIRNEL